MPKTERISSEIIIIGGGPTGLTLANLLGKTGVKIHLIEQNKETVNEPRAVSIDDESLRVFQSIGIKERVNSIIVEGYGSIYKSYYGKEFSRVMPTSKEYGFEKRNAFQQPELEKILSDNLSTFNSVRTFFNWKMIEFSQKPSNVQVTIQSQQSDKIKKLTGKFLVACDGASSTIRKSLNIPLQGSSFEETWVIVDLLKTINRNRHTEVFCNPDRPCITLPGPKQTRRYEFMLRSGENIDHATSELNVRTLMESVGPDKNQKIKRIRSYTFHARVAKKWKDQRVFLAGDSAHLSPPFAGQGMNSGIRDAGNLGWKLAVSLSDAKNKKILDSYEEERKPHALEMINLALKMGRIMNPRNHFKAWLIRAFFATLGLYGPARDYIAQMKYKPKPRFYSGLIWPDNKKDTIVGQLVPQPITEDYKKNRKLLDEQISNESCILIFDESPDQHLTKRMEKKFLEKGCSIIGLTPEWVNAYEGNIRILRDASHLFSRNPYRSYLGSALLIRQDKYIAATAPIDNIEKLLEYLREITS